MSDDGCFGLLLGLMIMAVIVLGICVQNSHERIVQLEQRSAIVGCVRDSVATAPFLACRP